MGLSLIVAAGFVALREQPSSRRSVVAGVALLIFVHNISYLWIRKQRQYIERAEPTELLVKDLRDRQGPVDVYCFPYASNAAELAVSMRLGSQVQPRVAVMGQPAVPRDGAVDLCGTGTRARRHALSPSRAALAGNLTMRPSVADSGSIHKAV